MELAIVKYIKKHGLEKTVKDFELKMNDYGHKVSIKYDQINSPMGEAEVQDARGLILEKGTWKVMSLSYRKFFNVEEGHADKIDWTDAHVLEKLDGTLIQLYWDWVLEEWCVGTTGTADGGGDVNKNLNMTFASLFWKTMERYNFDVTHLSKIFNYTFELMTPYNIVVKPHVESSAVMTGSRHMATLKEVPYNELRNVARVISVSVVDRIEINQKNFGVLKRMFKNMSWEDEGFVVVDHKFRRVKLKNPTYVEVHHLKSKTAEHAILGVVKTNEIDEFLITCPEREEEIRALKVKYDDLMARLNAAWEDIKPSTPKNITAKEKKKFAMAVFEQSKKHDVDNFTRFFFAIQSGKAESIEDALFDYDNKKLFKML